MKEIEESVSLVERLTTFKVSDFSKIKDRTIEEGITLENFEKSTVGIVEGLTLQLVKRSLLLFSYVEIKNSRKTPSEESIREGIFEVKEGKIIVTVVGQLFLLILLSSLKVGPKNNIIISFEFVIPTKPKKPKDLKKKNKKAEEFKFKAMNIRELKESINKSFRERKVNRIDLNRVLTYLKFIRHTSEGYKIVTEKGSLVPLYKKTLSKDRVIKVVEVIKDKDLYESVTKTETFKVIGFDKTGKGTPYQYHRRKKHINQEILDKSYQ